MTSIGMIQLGLAALAPIAAWLVFTGPARRRRRQAMRVNQRQVEWFSVRADLVNGTAQTLREIAEIKREIEFIWADHSKLKSDHQRYKKLIQGVPTLLQAVDDDAQSDELHFPDTLPMKRH